MEHKLVVIGGSAGAVEALAQIVRGLPLDLAAAIAAVVHFPQTSTSVLPAILERAGRFPARHAVNGEPIRPGRIYVAPPGSHLLVAGDRFRLTRGPRENGNRPALDPLFRTAAHQHGPNVIGVVLTGNLDDGTVGLAAIKQRGGMTVVQDPATANFPGMPESAMAHVKVDYVIPLDEIPACITALVAEPVARAGPREHPMVASHDPNGEEHILAATIKPENRASGFTCPECHGALWEQRSGELLHYECRVGHAYSSDSLLAEHADDLEQSLWSAFRTLEEHAALARRLADAATRAGHNRTASAYTERAVDCEHHAAVIHRTLQRMDARLVQQNSES